MHEYFPPLACLLVIFYIVSVSLSEFVTWQQARAIGERIFGERIMRFLEHNFFIYGLGSVATGIGVILFSERRSAQYKFGMFLMVLGWVFISLAILRTGLFRGRQYSAIKTVSLSCCVAMILISVVVWPYGKSPIKPTRQEQPPTLLDFFLQRDFANTLRVHSADMSKGDITLRWKDGSSIQINEQIYLDFPAKTKFVGFYVFRPSLADSSSEKTFLACMGLVHTWPSTKSDDVQYAFHHLLDKRRVSGGSMDKMNNADELMFSGRVLLYHEDNLSILQKAEIIKAFSRKNYDVQFMGPEYLQEQLVAWSREHSVNRP